MASSARYHLLPEQGRPSIDSQPDAMQRLIDVESDAGANIEYKYGVSQMPVTLYLRLISSAFFLAAAIVLGLRQGYHGPYWSAPSETAIPSIVFLSIAMARNLMVVFLHFVRSGVRVHVSVHISGLGKSKARVPEWSKGKGSGILLDGSIITALFITLPIGLTQSLGWYTGLQDGFIVALVGMPFYLFSIVDGGSPRNVSLSLQLTRCKSQDGIVHVETAQEYRDIETAQPDVTRIVGLEEEHDVGEGEAAG